MANNHIMDYGERGLFDTIEHLDKMKIKHLGAGINLKEASKPLTIFFDKKKVAVLNFCENEWSIAQNNCCGSNPMDLIENAKQINEANESHDTVIVIIHGGHEYFKLPSPRMQKQYRFYADQGANLIVGHHTHCIGGYENYNGIPIYYSLGNFLFTKNNICEHWYNGFILDVDLRYDQISSEIIPINQEKKSFNLAFLDKDKRKELINEFEEINKIIKNEEELNLHWTKYSEEQMEIYLNFWSPLSFVNNRFL